MVLIATSASLVACRPPALPGAGIVSPASGSPVEGCSAGRGPGRLFEGSEVEGHLSADASRPGQLVAAWQQDRFEFGGARAVLTAVSSDGGMTWRRSEMPQLSLCGGARAGTPGAFQRVTDPWLVHGSDKDVYLATLSVDVDPASVFGVGREAILVTRSRDGGRSWSRPVAVITDQNPAVFNDKPSLSAHHQRPGRLYAAWGLLERRGFLTEGVLMLSTSSDHGASWSPPRPIFDPGDAASAFAPQIAALDGGRLLAVWTTVRTQSDGRFTFELSALTSDDDGRTWSRPAIIARPETNEVIEPTSGLAVVDGAHIPALAVDRTGGIIYVAWLERVGSVNAFRLALSRDGGRSWEAAEGVTPRRGGLLPSLAVSPSGEVALGGLELVSDRAHLTARPLLATCAASACVAESDWQVMSPRGPVVDLARAPLTEGPFVGDYLGLAWTGSGFGLLYAATDGGPGATSQYLVTSN